MSYTEFINAIDVIHRLDYVRPKCAYLPEERPVVFQIFDNEPERILAAALRLQEFGPDIIDVNMGCSVNSVAGRGAGAGLLREPQKAGRIVHMLARALDIPVTVKIRLGWDESERNYLEIARRMQDSGAALLAVHGRTRAQGYGGRADWDAIAEIKAALSIPVVGNGDVRTVADIDCMQAHTGCDAVMIGRAAMGNPWIFRRQDRLQVSPEALYAGMLDHLERMLEFYEGDYGLILFRKHAVRYLKPFHVGSTERNQLLTTARPTEFVLLLKQVIEKHSKLPPEGRERMEISYSLQ